MSVALIDDDFLLRYIESFEIAIDYTANLLHFSKPGSMKKRRFTNGGHARFAYPAWPDPHPNGEGQLAEWISRLRVEATSAVEWILKPCFYHEPRLTTDVNWMWIPDGRGEVRIGEDQTPILIQPGDHVFLPAGTFHAEWFPMQRIWRLFSLHFTATLYGGVDFIAASGFPLLIRGEPKNGLLSQVAARLCREFNLRAPGWPVAFRAGIETALMYVLRHHGRQFRPDYDLIRRKAEFRLIPAFDMIDTRLGDNTLSIRELARLLKISEVRFRTLFHQATGKTPIQFIIHRRIEKARRLLVQTERNAKEISILCGFKDPAFFHRVFRASVGETPRQFRFRINP